MVKNSSPEDVVRKYLDKHLEPDFLTEEEQVLIEKYHDQLKKPEEDSFPIEYHRNGVQDYERLETEEDKKHFEAVSSIGDYAHLKPNRA